MATTQLKTLLGKRNENETSNTLKDQMSKISAIDDGVIMKLVPIQQIKPSNLNDFDINREDINSIKESIRTTNILIHPFLLMPIDDNGDGYLYEILSGEQRYHAVKELIEEGHEKYKKGVPATLTDRNLSITEQKILIKEANIKQRGYDSRKIRETVQELVELYKERNEEKGTNNSVIKQVADVLGKDPRQIQRFNSLSKLIPELKDAFDRSEIGIERASQFASMDEESQKLVVELMESNSKITKKEVLEIQNLKKEQEKEYNEKINNLSLKLEQIEKDKQTIENSLSEKDKEVAKVLHEKDNEFKIALSEKENLISSIIEQEEQKRKALEEELLKSKPNDEEIVKLKDEILTISKEKENLIEKVKEEKEKELAEKNKQLELKNKEIAEIKKELEKALNKDIAKVNETEILKVKMESEVNSLIENTSKSISLIYEKINDANEKGLTINITNRLIDLKETLEILLADIE